MSAFQLSIRQIRAIRGQDEARVVPNRQAGLRAKT